MFGVDSSRHASLFWAAPPVSPDFFFVVGLRGQSLFPSTFKATVHPKRKTLIPPTRTSIKNSLVLFALPALLLLLRGAVRLHPFLLSQLERAADHSAKARAERGVSRAEMHPVLYPILLLLARLKAGGGGNGIEGEQTEVTGRGMLLVTWFDICFGMRENRRWLVCSLCRVNLREFKYSSWARKKFTAALGCAL